MSDQGEEMAAKKPKLSETPEKVPNRCQHFVMRKKRLCKMTTGKSGFATRLRQ